MLLAGRTTKLGVVARDRPGTESEERSKARGLLCCGGMRGRGGGTRWDASRVWLARQGERHSWACARGEGECRRRGRCARLGNGLPAPGGRGQMRGGSMQDNAWLVRARTRDWPGAGLHRSLIS